MPFTIIRQDITQMEVDAIVNAANTRLAEGGGVCGAIFAAAGRAEMQAACTALAPIKTGEAVITEGFALPSRFVIHAVGPIFTEWTPEESEILLRSAYRSALQLALENQCESIAFPLISSGIYGYPKAEALKVATELIHNFLAEHEMDIYLAVFDATALNLSEKLVGEVACYIDEHYVEQKLSQRRDTVGRAKDKRVTEDPADTFRELCKPTYASSMPLSEICIEDAIENLDEAFGLTLMRLIDAKGMSEVEVYKKANMDRKLFSKIRSGNGYMPSKRTVIALGVALELSLKELEDLLQNAGYALSKSQKFDVIIEFFFVSGQYDIFLINEVLFRYDQPLLGA